jgi:homoserine trans-succinylase
MDSNEIEHHMESDTDESRNIIRKWASKALLQHANFVNYYVGKLESTMYWRDFGTVNRN